MSWAKPCIGSQLDGARCVIQDGETGLLVKDPFSAQELAKKIIWLLDYPEKAQAMGENGLSLVRKQYLFPSFKERFLKALD